MTEPLEVVFFIHGVSPDKQGGSHSDEYETMHRGVQNERLDPHWPETFGGAEWGWNFDGGPLRSHNALAAAQNQLGTPVLELIGQQRDLTVNPARLLVNQLRELVFHGLGDMFYYVSADGKWAVRHEMARQILGHIRRRTQNADRPVSLTLIGHSAGSVIAFDFLYYVFSERQHQFLKSGEQGDTARGMSELRALARQGKIRLRRLVTIGSPISLVAFRSDALVEILARGEPLRPQDYGLTSTLEQQPALHGARWINIWDKDDPIAWPVAPLMNSPLAEDVYVDVSDRVRAAHNAYWDSSQVHKLIAERW